MELTNQVNTLLTFEEYRNGARRSLILTSQLSSPRDRFIDTSCSICTENFKDGEEVIMTPCNHSFHETCLTNWINSRIEKILIMIREAQEAGRELSATEENPQCPNCNYLLAPSPEEEGAID
jgi:hypothetical protein